MEGDTVNIDFKQTELEERDAVDRILREISQLAEKEGREEKEYMNALRAYIQQEHTQAIIGNSTDLGRGLHADARTESVAELIRNECLNPKKGLSWSNLMACLCQEIQD